MTYFSSIRFLPEPNSKSTKLNLNFEYQSDTFARPRREQAIKASFLHAKSGVGGMAVGFVDAIKPVKQATSTFFIFQICCKLTFLSS